MEEFEERKTRILTTGEWYNPVSNMLHHVYKGFSRDWAGEGRRRRRRNDSVLDRLPGLFSLDCRG